MPRGGKRRGAGRKPNPFPDKMPLFDMAARLRGVPDGPNADRRHRRAVVALASYGASTAEIAAVLDVAIDDLAAFAEDVKLGAVFSQCNLVGAMWESARFIYPAGLGSKCAFRTIVTTRFGRLSLAAACGSARLTGDRKGTRGQPRAIFAGSSAVDAPQIRGRSLRPASEGRPAWCGHRTCGSLPYRRHAGDAGVVTRGCQVHT
jgi:hypothetical protein